MTDELRRVVAAAAVRDPQTVDAAHHALPPAIDGVVLHRPVVHADHRGSLTLVDVGPPVFVEPIVQMHESIIRPGRIKGWAMHTTYDDRYLITQSYLRVGLFDGRHGSPTEGAVVQIFFTPETPGLLRIPAGVWHADQNWGQTPARVLVMPSRPYTADAPDKARIDPHAGVIPFDWSLPDY